MLIHTESITARDAQTAGKTHSFVVLPAAPSRPQKRGLLAAIAGFFEALIPLGYEDEEGFHFGIEPSANALRRTASRENALQPYIGLWGVIQQPHTFTATTPLDNESESNTAADQPWSNENF